MYQQILIAAITIFTAAALVVFIFFYLIPNQHAKNAIKQKAKEDREAKIRADYNLSEYPTLSRHCVYEGYEEFEDTQLGATSL